MTSPKRLHFKICVDHMIDLITNSSSELFVIDNKMTKPTLVEMVNAALQGTGFSISEGCIEERFIDDTNSAYDHEWKIENALEIFDKSDREEIKKKYLSSPKWYGISFDRDKICQSDSDIREKLSKIGFEMVNGDY